MKSSPKAKKMFWAIEMLTIPETLGRVIAAMWSNHATYILLCVPAGGKIGGDDHKTIGSKMLL